MTTSRFVYGDDARLVEWAEARIPHHRFRHDAKAIGHELSGKLAAVSVFDTFSPNGCLIGVASEPGAWRWSSRAFLMVTFAYPFIQCGFNRLTAIVSSLNPSSLRYIRHLGWAEEGLLREAGPLGEDMVVFGLLRCECRYLPPVFGAAGKMKQPAL